MFQRNQVTVGQPHLFCSIDFACFSPGKRRHFGKRCFQSRIQFGKQGVFWTIFILGMFLHVINESIFGREILWVDIVQGEN